MSRRFLLIVLVPVIWLTTVTAVAHSATLIDMTQREVTIPGDADRILCLGPGTLRLIVYLQAEKKVVGVEALEKNYPGGRPYWLAHPELASLPTCGPGGVAAINQKPDLETVLKLAPEVILVTYMDAALADDVQTVLNIPVVVLSYGDFSTFDETVYTALRLAAAIVDRNDRAEAVIRSIEAWRADLSRRSVNDAGEKRPKAYIGGIGFRKVQGIESTQHNYPPLEWINADNLARRMETKAGSHVVVPKEMLLNLDPPTIFIDGGGLGLVTGDVARKPEYYRMLTAFAKRRVFVLHPFNWYTTNIDTALTDAYAMGKILYPKRFADVDPERKADEIYTELVGRPVYEKMKADYGPNGRVAPFVD
ncbi:ABC transporter substrate-binding protein [Desulfosarcina ovata]|uniref:Iron ABC transporter substrate-binding protein n=1 Tax=Desulfosarcina ovata subsp. ovata TaxID=2752305 RepID=A0A5K8ABX9_9BACT|nr:ABC transporter substrate-binding protein [Desulfosarcina ovata]BBO89534.1 iron ABC transporter substrate-binding protein [Desulfosarcina ovata subsp. ovata]